MAKKIMFNDKYSLTQAVLEGWKTTTRRIVTDKKLHYWKCSCPDMVIVKVPESQKLKTDDDNTYFGIKDKISSEYYCDTITSPYKVGEVVAIAQSYKDLGYDAEEPLQEDVGYYPHIKNAAGWNNKMFVRSEACKHHIRITNVKIERLQDISDEDCVKLSWRMTVWMMKCLKNIRTYSLAKHLQSLFSILLKILLIEIYPTL